jgi:hypothetical protein
MEEIDHARRCFALAAGYGGRSHSVEPMPDLLLAGLELSGSALEALAVESLKDGCLLEDFNADVAAQCEKTCEAPVTRDVLARIAREERSHAEFSWNVLAWALERGGKPVQRAVSRAIDQLDSIARPTAVSDVKQAVVGRANIDKLRAHGRLPDAEWAALYTPRVAATKARARDLVGELRVAA